MAVPRHRHYSSHFIMFQFPFFFFPPPSDAVMAESETPKVTTPIARTSRRARLRNWLWLFSFFKKILFLCIFGNLFICNEILYLFLFLYYFYSFNIGTWHQSKLGMMMCKDTTSSRLLINLVLFFIKKKERNLPVSVLFLCTNVWRLVSPLGYVE